MYARSPLMFCCQLCGCGKYVQVKVRRPNGHWYTTEFYRCFGCSVMFTDPEQFSGDRFVGDGADRAPVSFEPGGAKS